MTHRTLDLRIETGRSDGEAPATIAVTVHLPEQDRLSSSPPLLLCLPGGGYNRRYFDLAEAGYSEAAHHVARRVIVVAMDHLGVGDSDTPEGGPADLSLVARRNNAALQAVLAKLQAGELDGGIAPISPSVVIGEGQSMGGQIALLMQAAHGSFDGLALLGCSAVCTRLPARIADGEVCLRGEADHASELAKLKDFDWRWAFHWDDVPEQFAGAEEAASLGRAPLPYWRSATALNAFNLFFPGAVSREAASVNLPLLIGMGERDVCQDPLRELAAYASCRDIALFVGRKMGHMHNFAGTRHALWRRLTAFIDQVAAEKRT